MYPYNRTQQQHPSSGEQGGGGGAPLIYVYVQGQGDGSDGYHLRPSQLSYAQDASIFQQQHQGHQFVPSVPSSSQVGPPSLHYGGEHRDNTNYLRAARRPSSQKSILTKPSLRGGGVPSFLPPADDRPRTSPPKAAIYHHYTIHSERDSERERGRVRENDRGRESKHDRDRRVSLSSHNISRRSASPVSHHRRDLDSDYYYHHHGDREVERRDNFQPHRRNSASPPPPYHSKERRPQHHQPEMSSSQPRKAKASPSARPLPRSVQSHQPPADCSRLSPPQQQHESSLQKKRNQPPLPPLQFQTGSSVQYVPFPQYSESPHGQLGGGGLYVPPTQQTGAPSLQIIPPALLPSAHQQQTLQMMHNPTSALPLYHFQQGLPQTDQQVLSIGSQLNITDTSMSPLPTIALPPSLDPDITFLHAPPGVLIPPQPVPTYQLVPAGHQVVPGAAAAMGTLPPSAIVDLPESSQKQQPAKSENGNASPRSQEARMTAEQAEDEEMDENRLLTEPLVLSGKPYKYCVNVGKDVVSGKGGRAQQYNRHFRKMITESYPRYNTTVSKAEKREIGIRIYLAIVKTGGRFLDSQGIPMNRSKAILKVMKALKDAKSWNSEERKRELQLYRNKMKLARADQASASAHQESGKEDARKEEGEVSSAVEVDDSIEQDDDDDDESLEYDISDDEVDSYGKVALVESKEPAGEIETSRSCMENPTLVSIEETLSPHSASNYLKRDDVATELDAKSEAVSSRE